MNKIAHRLALIGAWSQVLLAINFVIGGLRISAAIGGMDFTDPNDMDAVMGQIGGVTQSLSGIANQLALGLIVSLSCLCLFLYSVVRLSYRRGWAFWFSCLYGIVLLFLFPIGTLFGLFLLSYGMSHRAEFAGKVPMGIPSSPAAPASH